ncbi:zinc finger protein GAI-ASSOCIATED FACTOR 1 isoform X2 [Vitis vinifera]|uniref:zinc finger protein GAI-ASSOCIATED FACTOR 1 isoform X2 n=1 Tax=Vitis vinifera TaxID=29760 RepID=UPI00053F833E|nr:zinc finger protein GAI-ASSOCIATED FACTOR 1 isoform X2 [Vitis vinifera]|eukprot:XP_010664668.1 PREDICTED: protein indeterminate-domain 2 isoform X2 [Vitis vinifera]
MVELDISSPMTVSTASREASVTSSGNQTAPQPVAPTKKKRNLPGTPDPDAEVIALSPKTLMATNRFVCEICNKGFQRDQNLQLHRRGHNLPWKLRQRTSKEVRKRVYVCPEPTCVHHDPTRALGDLTGIKKHFCRKHGEKKWKCERCSKKYAVQSDWKAHLKTCGTREYKCDCGTLFSRRDSFITHRAFCDALAQESARAQVLPSTNTEENPEIETAVSSSPTALSPSTTVLSIQSPDMTENPVGVLQQAPATISLTTGTVTSSSSSSTSVFASIFAPSTTPVTSQPPQSSSTFSDLICAMGRSKRSTTLPSSSTAEPTLRLSSSLYLSNSASSLFPTPDQNHRHYAPSPQPAMSATALLQKAAQMGAAASNASLLRGLGLAMSPSSSAQQDSSTTQWSGHVKADSNPVGAGLGLGLPSEGGPALTGLMMSPSSLFVNKPTTLDLLGLGMVPGGASTAGLSALLTSISGGGLDIAAAGSPFGGAAAATAEAAPDRKPNGPALL